MSADRRPLLDIGLPFRPPFVPIGSNYSDVDSPLNFKYVRQLRFLISSVGAWPHKQFGRPRLDAMLSVYNLLLILVAMSLPTLGAIYIWYYRQKISFFDVGHVFLCMCLGSIYLQRLVLSRTAKYRETIRDFLLEFHLFYFKDRSDYAAKIHTQIHVISGMFTLYVICQMMGGMILFTFMPWYNNYSRGMFSADRPLNSTFEHSVYFYCFTEDVFTDLKSYWILFVFNIPTAYNTSSGVCIFDLLLCLIVFQIWGHLKVLKHNLLSFPLPAVKGGMYSQEENLQIRQLLKDNILYHSLIIDFVNKCSDTFSEYLFWFYLLMQFITCILLLEVSAFTADALAKYGALTVGMHQQLIQVSILFEMIHTKSEQLIDAVYATPWERMDARNRRIVMLLLRRAQAPVSLRAAKVVPVGVNTMSAIIRRSLSYYMMLNAVAGER